MPGKSKLTADAAEQAVLRALSKSEHRGEADRARAIPGKSRRRLLRMRARPGRAVGAALASVRAEGTDGWGTVLRSGLIGPRSQRAPIRHRGTHPTPTPRRE